ncbi:MAG: glycosyltransferase, partial [Candidatus Hydrothermae bacterium]|nr:glycosyltransferase [Candidatus Hydrothermae bacterium]
NSEDLLRSRRKRSGGMDTPPELTLLFVNWHGGQDLLDALDSLGSDPYVPAQVRVWVVDGNTRDPDPETARSVYPGLTWIQLGDNPGYGGAVNRVLEKVATPFVAVANTDLLFPPGTLRHLVQFLKQHPGAGWVGPRIETPEGLIQSEMLLFEPSFWKAVVDLLRVERVPFRWIAREIRFPLPFATIHRPRRAPQTYGAMMLFRTRALREAGGFPEEVFLFGEELLLGARMRRAGWEGGYDPRVRVIHRQGKSIGKLWNMEERFVRVREAEWLAYRSILPWWKAWIWWALKRTSVEVMLRYEQWKRRPERRARYEKLRTVYRPPLGEGPPR